MSKKFNVCVVGATGAVGETILSILDERDFPMPPTFEWWNNLDWQ
jgi:aspartate-semialdehyde dehydrogenase